MADLLPLSFQPEYPCNISVYSNIPLQLDSQEIRILELEDSQGKDAPITATLKVVSLTASPHHFALSYTWGEPIFDHSVTCNGFHFPITENLCLALQRLRNTNKRVLWVDQICIQQTSLTERSHQVRMMYQIYQMAENVCVWLGSHQAGTGLGLEFVHNLASCLFKASDIDACYQALLRCDQDLRDATWVSFNQLYEIPWLFRCWVVQEVVAKPSPIAFLGDYEFDWIDLPYAYLAMSNHKLMLAEYIFNRHRTAVADHGGRCCLAIAHQFAPIPDDFAATGLIGECRRLRTNVRLSVSTVISALCVHA